MIFQVFVVLVCLYSTNLAIVHGARNDPHPWLKLNTQPVCFEARNNKPGIFQPFSEGLVSAVKLVHRRGTVTCNYRVKSLTSNWGCHNLRNIETTPLNILITDDSNTVLFPKVGATFTTGSLRTGKWYGVPGFDAKSDHLVLQHGFNAPYQLGPKSRLKIWYGEDLYNFFENDNRGRVCVDIFGLFV